MDETGKRLESKNFYSWSPKGKPTIIEHNGSHKGLNIIGATEILQHFDFVYTTYSKDDGAITTEHIISYFEKLLQYDRSRGISKTIVIMYNARIHISEDMKQFAIAHENDLILLQQPPYSPELNPQENMWNWLKKFIYTASANNYSDNILVIPYLIYKAVDSIHITLLYRIQVHTRHLLKV